MTELSFENHIMTQLDEELEEIRTRLMEMGGKVEQQLKTRSYRYTKEIVN